MQLPMGFWIRSREEVQSANPVVDPHIVISINTPGDGPADVVRNDNTLFVMPFFFDDLDGDPGEAYRAYMERDAVLFNEDMAGDIIEALRDQVDPAERTIKGIVVHCDAGISRSAGVGAALALWFNGEEQLYGRGLVPNKLVYRTMLNVLQQKGLIG